MLEEDFDDLENDCGGAHMVLGCGMLVALAVMLGLGVEAIVRSVY